MDGGLVNMAKCYLRKTEITLLDGAKYAFRALPFTPKCCALLGDLNNPEKAVLSTMEAVIISLSYDQTQEEIDAIFESGIIPFVAYAGLEKALWQKIMNALVATAETNENELLLS